MPGRRALGLDKALPPETPNDKGTSALRSNSNLSACTELASAKTSPDVEVSADFWQHDAQPRSLDVSPVCLYGGQTTPKVSPTGSEPTSKVNGTQMDLGSQGKGGAPSEAPSTGHAPSSAESADMKTPTPTPAQHQDSASAGKVDVQTGGKFDKYYHQTLGCI